MKIEIINEELDIGMLLDDVYKDFKNYVEASGININYEEIDDDIYISGDYKRLKQVFINIIKNSMEAIKEKNKVQIVYKSINSGITKRIIHPAELFCYIDRWYVAAFCELRNEIRLFKLEDILEYEVLEEKYESKKIKR